MNEKQLATGKRRKASFTDFEADEEPDGERFNEKRIKRVVRDVLLSKSA